MQIPKLYKYRYFDEPSDNQRARWETVLFEGKVFPAPPTTFNDPFDCDLLIDDSFLKSNYFKDMLQDSLIEKYPSGRIGDNAMGFDEWKSNFLESDTLSMFREKMLDTFRDFLPTIKEEMLIACFSELNNSVLMWSHYAQYHTGFCIEYDLNDWPGCDNLYQVQYSINAPVYGQTYLDRNTPAFGSAVVDAALHKSNEWCYEKEWRIVVPKQNYAPIYAAGFRPAFDFSRFITAIYIGAKAKEEHIQKICQHFHLQPIKIYQMSLQPMTYKLNANRLQ